MWIIDLSLILFSISRGLYSIPKESKYTALFLSIDNGTQWVPLLLSTGVMTYALLFILGKLFLKISALKSRFIIEIISKLDIV